MCERLSDFPYGNQLFILKAKLLRISCGMVKPTAKRKNSSSQKLLQLVTESCSIKFSNNSNCKTTQKLFQK